MIWVILFAIVFVNTWWGIYPDQLEIDWALWFIGITLWFLLWQVILLSFWYRRFNFITAVKYILVWLWLTAIVW